MSQLEQFSLSRDATALVLIDFQDGLYNAMDPDRKVEALQNTRLLLSLASTLSLPVLVTEQYRRGLGPTNAELNTLLPEGTTPIDKLVFSSWRADGFEARFRETGASAAILCGMETHVCVLGTALDLLREGINVHVARDAVISRTRENWNTGLKMMDRAGAVISSTETAIFQLLGEAGTEEFKTMARLLR